MNTFAVRGGKRVVTKASPHVVRPPESNIDEIDEIKAIRDGGLSMVKQQSLHDQFQGLFLDYLDNKVRYSAITPGFLESVRAIITVLDIGEGDEVVCSPFADYALHEALERSGATVVVHDCDKETGLVSIDQILRCVTDETKVIFITHHRGNPIDIASLRARNPGHALLIEDCSYAHGAYYDDHGRGERDLVGTQGDLAVFGLQYEKLIYAGQGAMVVSNNRLIIDCIKQVFKVGYQGFGSENMHTIGTKYMLSPLQVTVGKYSLRQFLYTRRGADKCLAYFRERMNVVSYCTFVAACSHGTQSSRYGFVLRYDTEKLRKLPIYGLVTLLKSEGVEVRLAEDTVIECLRDKGVCSDYHAATISKQLLFLPSFYDRYQHKEVIDQYIAAFRKIQLNLFC